jgi:hypothetical protein
VVGWASVTLSVVERLCHLFKRYAEKQAFNIWDNLIFLTDEKGKIKDKKCFLSHLF